MQEEKKLHVLFVSGWYPSRVDPFLGNFVQKHAEAVSLYCAVSVLHVHSDAGMKKKFEVVAEVINGVFTVNVYYKKVVHKVPGLSGLQKFSRYLKAHRMGYEFIKEKKGTPDLIHQHVLWPAGLFVRKLHKETGIPYLVTEHNTAYTRGVKPGAFEKLQSKRIADGAALITPVSLDLARTMEKLGLGSRFEVVNNVVDTSLFYPGPEKKKSRTVFLHISTLRDEHKNVSGILRAVKRLAEKRSDFELHIAGDGDIQPHRHYARELGLPDTLVTFDGPQSTAEIARLMRGSHCLVLFSNYENLPVVIPEAFASGIPVISSRVGGIAEVVNEKNGLLVEAKDEEGLAAAMEVVLERLKKNAYDEQALHAYAQAFSYPRVGEHFLELYQRVLAGK
jgi:glycosyltransferase involved in cell wall biosynthesis